MRTLVAKYRNILKNVDVGYVRNIHNTIPWNVQRVSQQRLLPLFQGTRI